MPVLIAGTLGHRPRWPNSMSAFEGITDIVTAGAQVRNWTPERAFTPNEARSEWRDPAQLVGVFDRIAHRWYYDAR
jgi:hypothetical protein